MPHETITPLARIELLILLGPLSPSLILAGGSVSERVKIGHSSL